jgi:hypothetical protein
MMQDDCVKSAVIVKFEFEGIHHWPECPLEDVAFLRDKHRHIFHVEAAKQVTHHDREVEIIRLKRELQSDIREQGIDLGRRSCEDLAYYLLTKYGLLYCKVLEDNENGAYLWATK